MVNKIPKINYKQRNDQGFLIYRCNRCGAKLNGLPYLAGGTEPLCNSCGIAIRRKNQAAKPVYVLSDIQPSKRFLMSTHNGKHTWHQHRSCRSIDRMFEKIKDGD